MKNIVLATLFIAPTTGHALHHLKRLANFADKAIFVGGGAYGIHTSYTETNKMMATAQPLRADGAEPTQRMVADLCKKLDVNYENIEIKQLLGNYAGEAAAFNSLFGKNTVFVGEEVLKLPHYQQKSIIAHELTHIKNRDNFKTVGAATAISLGAVGSFRLGHHVLTKAAIYAQNTFAKRNFNSVAQAIDKTKNIALSPLKSFTLPLIAACHPPQKGGITTYPEYNDDGSLKDRRIDDGGKKAGIGLQLFARYQRFLEKRADIESAKKAGTAQGIIDMCEANLKQKSRHDLPPMEYTYTTALDSHPCLKERIEYLQPFVQEKK